MVICPSCCFAACGAARFDLRARQISRQRRRVTAGRRKFKEFMNRHGFDMIYLDSVGFAAFMKADNEDNGKALKSLGLAK